MNVKFNEVERKGVDIIEVTFNTKMLYIVKPNDDISTFCVVDPFVMASTKEFQTFDAASEFAAALITGESYE